MPNVHIHLHVEDLNASTAFCERFFGIAPAKTKPGYAKFLGTIAPINLALSAGQPGTGKHVDHLGFEVETREAVQSILTRVKREGLAVREEMDSNCCYANQDKFWVVDPDGIEWEVYHLNYDINEDALAPVGGQSTCCTPLARISRRT
jgi:catechol-2,3-dioxygenase